MRGQIKQIKMPTPFSVGSVNGWLLLGDEPTLVDVGPCTDEAWEALLAGLASYGLKPEALRHIFITHAHADHYGNGARLKKAAPDAILYAPDVANARPIFEENREEHEHQARFYRAVHRMSGLSEETSHKSLKLQQYLDSFGCLLPVTRWVQPGDELRFGGEERWQVVGLPGHSMTQVGLWQMEKQLLFLADHLLPRISSNALLEPPPRGQLRREHALLKYRATLQWTAALPPQQIFPGHGDPFFDQRPLIAKRLRQIDKRASHVHKVLIKSPRTIIELVKRLFPLLPKNHLFLAISEVVGHLELLEMQGKIGYRGEVVREYYVVDS